MSRGDDPGDDEDQHLGDAVQLNRVGHAIAWRPVEAAISGDVGARRAEPEADHEQQQCKRQEGDHAGGDEHQVGGVGVIRMRVPTAPVAHADIVSQLGSVLCVTFRDVVYKLLNRGTDAADPDEPVEVALVPIGSGPMTVATLRGEGFDATGSETFNIATNVLSDYRILVPRQQVERATARLQAIL